MPKMKKPYSVTAELENRIIRTVTEQYQNGNVSDAYVLLCEFLNKYPNISPKLLTLKQDILINHQVYESLFEVCTQRFSLFKMNSKFDILPDFVLCIKSLYELNKMNALSIFLEYFNLKNLYKQMTDLKNKQRFKNLFIEDEKSVHSKQYVDMLHLFTQKNYSKVIEKFERLSTDSSDYLKCTHLFVASHFHLGNYEECIKKCRAVVNKSKKDLEKYYITLIQSYHAINNKNGERFYCGKLLTLANNKKFDIKTVQMILNIFTEYNAHQYIFDFTETFLKYHPFDSVIMKYHAISAFNLDKKNICISDFETLSKMDYTLFSYYCLQGLKTNDSIAGLYNYSLPVYQANKIDYIFSNFINDIFYKDEAAVQKYLKTPANFRALFHMITTQNIKCDDIVKIISADNGKLNQKIIFGLLQLDVPCANKFNILKAFNKAFNHTSLEVSYGYIYNEVQMLPYSYIHKFSDELFDAYLYVPHLIMTSGIEFPIYWSILNFCCDLIIACVNSKNVLNLNEYENLCILMFNLYFFACYTSIPYELFKDQQTFAAEKFKNFEKIASKFNIKIDKDNIYIKDREVDIQQVFDEYKSSSKIKL